MIRVYENLMGFPFKKAGYVSPLFLGEGRYMARAGQVDLAMIGGKCRTDTWDVSQHPTGRTFETPNVQRFKVNICQDCQFLGEYPPNMAISRFKLQSIPVFQFHELYLEVQDT